MRLFLTLLWTLLQISVLGTILLISKIFLFLGKRRNEITAMIVLTAITSSVVLPVNTGGNMESIAKLDSAELRAAPQWNEEEASEDYFSKILPKTPEFYKSLDSLQAEHGVLSSELTILRDDEEGILGNIRYFDDTDVARLIVNDPKVCPEYPWVVLTYNPLKEEIDKIPEYVIEAQFHLESASGTSALARNSHNYYGIKCGHKICPHAPRCKPYRDEKPGMLFRTYTSREQADEAHKEFLSRPRYAWIWEKYSNPDSIYSVSWNDIPSKYRAKDYWNQSREVKRVWVTPTQYLRFDKSIQLKGWEVHLLMLSATGYASNRRYYEGLKKVITSKNLYQ